MLARLWDQHNNMGMVQLVKDLLISSYILVSTLNWFPNLAGFFKKNFSYYEQPFSSTNGFSFFRKGNNGTHGSGSSKQEGSANVKVLFEPLQLGSVSNLDELEVKTLKFQNQKLGLRLTQRLAIEEELKLRIDQLEKRQTQDDAVINVIHR